MGQKINPIGLRLGINRTWDSRWFAGKAEYGKLLHEDVKIREILHKELKQAAVARIVTSSCSSLPYSALPANQRESQVRLMPSRSPIGLIF